MPGIAPLPSIGIATVRDTRHADDGYHGKNRGLQTLSEHRLNSLTPEILYRRDSISPVMLSGASEASRSWLVERDSSLAPLTQNDTICLVGLRESFAG